MTKCYYCGCELFPGNRIRNKQRPGPTKDHVIPRYLRGKSDACTLVMACKECNEEKAALTIEEFRVVKAFRFGYISGVVYRFPGEENE